ncbi:two-component system response regulator [Longimonas halophila]|uniref:Two-component system response regulator n=1 Tax=Longimonas halophila TaxID=1469170 RepID=A0A2H3NUH0_9BACT|nr:response regulator [Longimonas halophila]PEN08001.1 two-component system response regulator [Longimonas halophila]
MPHVLIVEDEPSIVTPLKFLMEQEGCSVQIVSDGAAVMPAIAAQRPDLILLDVMLPSRNGYDLCHAIRERPEGNDIAIIMLTVKGREVDIEKGYAMGADAYITKPFAVADVVATARRYLPDA